MTTLVELNRLFGETTVSRGLSYVRQGRVRSIAVEADGRITAKVQGNRRSPYTQSIVLTWDRKGVLNGIEGHCTCPVNWNCKHVAAVLIAREKADDRPRATRSHDPLALPVQQWLQRIREADAAQSVAPDGDGDAYPPTVQDRLLYVLDLERHTGRLIVTPMKGTLRKDGTLGKTVRRYDATRLGWEAAPKFIRPTDQRILHRIDVLGLGTYYHTRAAPEPGAILAFLEMVAGTGRGFWGEAHGPVLGIGETRRGAIQWFTGDDGSQQPRLRDVDGREIMLLPIEPPAYAEPASGRIGPLTLDMPSGIAQALLSAPEVPPDAAARVAEALAALRHARPAVPKPIRSETRTGIVPVPVLRLFAVSLRRSSRGWGAVATLTLPALRLGFNYDGRRVEVFPGGDPKFREGDCVVTVARDRAAEDLAQARLENSGAEWIDEMEFLAPDDGVLPFDRVFDPVADDVQNDALAFTAEEVPRLRAEGWRVEIDPSWPYRLHDGPVAIRAGVENGADGRLSLGFTATAGSEAIDLAPLIGSIIGVLPLDAEGALADGFDLDEFLEDLVLYQRLADGAHAPLQGEELAPLVRAVLAAPGLLGGFHPAESGRLPDLAEALEGSGIPFDGGKEIIALGRKLRALAAAPMVEPPEGLQAELRPYQKTGYGWLSALTETGFGGVLADDMGLGKTLQALALLVARHLRDGADRPSLLIVPTSLVGTWRREAERFAPDLRVLVLHGSDRHHRWNAVEDHHVVITTYPLLHRDHPFLFARHWEIAILDEAQAVKNPAAAVAKHIRGIEARTRIALTGTPMENSLGDLWALFDWLIPGLLGNRKAFRAHFLNPIERDGDAAAQAVLNARVRPFLLRRSKAEVAADLPGKSEFDEIVPLGDQQRALYETIRLSMDARVRDAIAAKGLAASRITILDALLKLRQVCCDPGLLKQAAKKPITESAKRARLMEMLESLIAEGRRVLVFSQFVTMLELIERDVAARGWAYAKLTGKTRNREDLVAGFQAGAAPLFLISLKAGGTGLTLTAADTVILYDPWWNPAVERQAMDRVHRIGQERGVFIYRFLAEGSVEEAITALQARKQALADALFEGAGEGPLALTEADVATLFRPLEAGPARAPSH